MKKSLFLAVLTVFMLLATITSVSAQNTVSKEYKEAVGKMLKASGAVAATEAVFPQITTMMKQSYPNIPDTFWDKMTTKLKTKIVDKLIDIYVPIYQKYLTLDDLKKIIAFYETPVGKKLSDSTPKIMIEGMQSGQELGMEIVKEMKEEVEGYKES